VLRAYGQRAQHPHRHDAVRGVDPAGGETDVPHDGSVEHGHQRPGAGDVAQLAPQADDLGLVDERGGKDVEDGVAVGGRLVAHDQVGIHGVRLAPGSARRRHDVRRPITIATTHSATKPVVATSAA
jgi:hypothetical protein